MISKKGQGWFWTIIVLIIMIISVILIVAYYYGVFPRLEEVIQAKFFGPVE